MDLYHQYENNYENRSETNLPPGFRFHPTDEELITYYLLRKVLDSSFNGRAIAEIDLNKCEPWELPGKAKMGEKEWYFYTLRDRKYPTGMRTNRATEGGYWKATGKDREIYSSKSCTLVGMKKTLVFYKGRAPKGEKSNWVMHEYRLQGKFAYHVLSTSSKDEWVISRVFQKSGTIGKKRGTSNMEYPYPDTGSPSSISLPPPLLDSTPFTTTTTNDLDNRPYDDESTSTKEHVSCFSMTTTTPSFHTSSMFDLPAPATMPSGTIFDAFHDPSSSSSRSSRNVYGSSPGFPSLKSLQENLQLNNFLMHGGGGNSNGFDGYDDNQMRGGFGPFGTLGNWAAGIDNNQQKAAGSSQFDCLWS